MTVVRQPAVAGSWYPGTRESLAREVDRHLAKVPDVHRDAPRALIAPHAGLKYSGPVAAHAYGLVRSHRYDAVVLVGPSHFVAFDGVALWPRGAWETPLGRLAIDERLADAIATNAAEVREYPIAHG